jgi:hypothetical protein
MASATKPRSSQTVRDLVLSMLVVGAFVAFLYVIVLRPMPEAVKTVDVVGPAAVARSAEVFPIAVPVGLASGWRPTSARFEPGPDPGTGTWFNGYVTPDNQFVAVAQSDHDVKSFVKDQTKDGVPQASVVIDGRSWQQYRAADGSQYSLVQTAPEATTIVTGTVTYGQLEEFAGKLETT